MSFMGGGGEGRMGGELYRVCTGPGKPGNSWNLIIWLRDLESHDIFVQVMELNFWSLKVMNCHGI